MVRRILLLALVSVSGIALLAPLAARSAGIPADPAPDPLLPTTSRVMSEALRGGTLSARTTAASGQIRQAAEQVVAAPDASPASVSMQAALVPIPTPPPPPPPPAPRRVVTYDGDTVWDRLAQCEASGNWAANTGNGYYGGLQFDLSTWRGYGGAAYAEYPHQATREEQIIVAERLRAARGYQPWPACRIKLGLP
jgi:resuscitation-promoting factor RpfB